MKKEIDISNIVKSVFKYKKLQLVSGEFHISDESIIRFLEFYSIAEYIRNSNVKKFSVREIANKKLIKLNKEYNYDNLHDFYTKINQRQINRMKINREILKSKNQNQRFKIMGSMFKNTLNIQEDNLNQLEVLFGINNLSKDSIEKVTYNRIRRNNLHNIKYKNLNDLIVYMKNNIDSSCIEYKNIEYYMIEYTINKELINTMSYCYNKVKNSYSHKDIMKVFVAIMKIPIIDARHKYIETYSEGLSFRDNIVLKNEVMGLVKFIEYCKRDIDMRISNYIIHGADIKFNKGYFKSIYDGGYESKYKLKKDFTSDDFKEVMKLLKDFNEEYLKNNRKKNIQKFNLLNNININTSKLILHSEIKEILNKNKIRINIVDRIGKEKIQEMNDIYGL